MNMKKTIAAIAAGAVAVSAMATTVSALEAKTLTYNLVKTEKNDDAAGTITATFTNVPLEAGGTVVIEAIGTSGASGDIAANSWGNYMMTISGSFWDDEAGTNKSFVPVVATRRNWETGYSVEGAALTDNNIVTIPVVAATAAATNVALKASSSAVITVTLKYFDLPSDVSYAGALNELVRDGKRGIILKTTAAGMTAGADSKVTYKTNGGTATVLYVTPEITDKVNAAAGADGINAQYDGSKWVTPGVAPTFEVQSVKEAADPAAGIAAKDVDISGLTAPVAYTNEQCNNSFTLSTLDGTAWTDQYGNAWTGTITYKDVTGAAAATAPAAGDVVVIAGKNGVNKGTTSISAAGTVAGLLGITPGTNDTLQVTGYAGGAAGSVLWTSPRSGAATETSGNSESKYPYRSSLKNSIYNTTYGDYATGHGEIFDHIGYANSDNSRDRLEIANAVKAVVNDAIQNYNDVVFTFNTATSKVKDGKYSTDDDAVDYTSFGRHFWDRDTGYDTNTIYITNDWLGNNLFEGALIINNNLTLSLGATDKFDWTATSLSFSWDAIQDAALTQNQYANYIQNMVLRTSTDWYWDNMTVTLGETETEEVDSGAPVEGNTEDLDEDEDEDFDFGDEDEDEDPVVDTTPDPEPEPEPAPAVASNPSTGNAPVALAVIPVALAAAAIVAKKRG